jgi:N-acetylglutamate synthase
VGVGHYDQRYRRAMHDTALIDQLMANAWPPEVTEFVGTSRLRWASGCTRRANSCLAIGEDDQIDEIVSRATNFYRQRGQAPVFLVSNASAPPSMASHLENLGFTSTARTMLLTASTAAVAAARTTPTGWAVEVTETPTDPWFDTYWSVESQRDRNDAQRSICRNVLLRRDSAAYVSVTESGRTIAVGQAVVEGDWAGIQCMATDPTHRRRSAASEVLTRLAQHALNTGATNLYLAVMHDNTGARRLYEQVGFSPTHDYSYFAP